jgi:hypothetical protein
MNNEIFVGEVSETKFSGKNVRLNFGKGEIIPVLQLSVTT